MTFRTLILIILGLANFAPGRPGTAVAGPVLSFDKASYTIAAANSTVQVQVFLSQVPGGTQVGPGNALLTAAIQVSFNNPSGVAAVLSTSNIAPSPSFDIASPGVSSTQATLAETSLTGISNLPVLLGTFTFTRLSPGTTQISVAALTPGRSFTSAGGDFLDPTAATASLTFVPEPSSAVIVFSGGPLLLVTLALRRRRRRGSSAS